MIAQFNTSANPSGSAKSSNTLVYLIVGAVVLYLGYKYLIKPEMDKQKAEQK